ncbi:MAG: T9SS-dependent M36 family metallopeptidase, partial [Bacteroidota bacterium]
MDMGGAGVVAGAMRTLALRKAKANVVGVVGLVENMPDSKAQRPGDIVKSMKGDTIEIINTDAEGRLVSFQQSFVEQLASHIAPQQAGISAQAAILSAGRVLDLGAIATISEQEAPTGPQQKGLYLASALSLDAIPAQLMYHPMKTGEVRLTWNLVIRTLDGQHWWDLWVDANSGELLDQEDWIVRCQWESPAEHAAHAHHQHFHPDVPTPVLTREVAAFGGQYRVYPLLTESPNHGAPALVTGLEDSLASPFGWHDTDGVAGADFTITQGNNVLAQEDLNGNNGSGYSPDGGASLNFDFPLDPTQPLATYEDAAITNLFVWNNLFHDMWYQYGFDEASGNFQENNYGRGGQAGDFVFADARDGSGTNNANFGTPPDGSNPRMQMFLWDPIYENLIINSPASVAGVYGSIPATIGPGLPASLLTEDLVLVEDGSGNNQGCNTLTNPGAVSGKIAVMDRGGCTFASKILNAQGAGAIAVIIVQNNGGGPSAVGGNGAGINIPAIMIGTADGNQIKTAINAGTVNGSIVDGEPLDGIDGDLDNGIIVHEYAHGISNRLTGGPAASGCLGNAEQAGEGWSDWYGLVMTARSSDVGSTPRGIGTFAVDQPTTGGGIRNFPYTTNMNVNPQTYDVIKTRAGSVHGIGEVMCTMLWDLYWALVDEHGYDADLYRGTGGNNIAMQLVTDGLKLQPCSPGFVDIRDAILLADELNYAGENQCLIWETFARRGLGFSADQGSPNSATDGTEAFDLPPSCQPILFMEKIVDRREVSPGDTLTYTLNIANRTGAGVTNVTVVDTLPPLTTLVPGSASCSVNDVAGTLLFNLGNMADGQVLSCSFQVVLDDNALVSDLVFQDNLDSTQNIYTPTSLVGTGAFRLDTLNPRSGTHAIFVPNLGEDNNQLLTLPILFPDSNSVFSFWHWYNTEGGWDGGFVEFLATGSGTGWEDLGPYMIQNGYNTVVGSNNPVGEREVFGGNSEGYIQTKADLSDFAGENVFLRFRFVSDNNTFEEGWFIDDLALGEEFVVLNQACISSAEGNLFCAEQNVPTLIVEPLTDPTAIDLLAFTSLDIFPNPTYDQLTIQWEGSEVGELRIRLFAPNGQLLQEQRQNQAAPQGSTQLSLEALPTGTYFIDIQQGEHRTRKKVLKF